MKTLKTRWVRCLYKDPNQLKALRKAYRESEAMIWKRVRELIEKGGREVNLDRIGKNTSNGDKVIVPGKVLGSGNIDHKVIIGALSFSKSAVKKIKRVGGEALILEDFVNRFKDGSKVKLIG